MSKKFPVVGIFCSDPHWQLDPPPFRSGEPDWLGCQCEYIDQLKQLQKKHLNAPIFIAGDLFNKWNSQPLLINTIIGTLGGGEFFAIPGNHDLPNHSYKQRIASAYFTLEMGELIHNLEPDSNTTIGNITVYPFPHGFPVKPPPKNNELCLQVALVHDYIWMGEAKHSKAGDDSRLKHWLPKLKGYDVAFFGDNHIPFIRVPEKDSKWQTTIVNCGTLTRRYSDEKDLIPSAWLLHSDGSVSRRPLDNSQDKFLELEGDMKALENFDIDLGSFTQELSELHAEKRDFAQIVARYCKSQKLPPEIENILLRSVGVVRCQKNT